MVSVEIYDQLVTLVDTANMDIITSAIKDMKIVEATDINVNVANNLILFRFNEETYQRELRIAKMDGVEHPLDWLAALQDNERGFTDSLTFNESL